MKSFPQIHLLVVFCLLLAAPQLLAQAPQKFNFQAVARTSTGELLGNSNMNVRLALYAKSDNSMIWQETHNISTSDLGIFSLNVGTGTRTGGDIASFSGIDWASDMYYLKVELMKDASWEDMGSTDLVSVPYALNASSVSNLSSLEVVEDFSNPADSALFEVRNKSGNTVFAVYNEGVRVYVDDNQVKAGGTRGGFAVAGFDDAKGQTYEFFRVTPDSIRVYVDETASKGSRGGFAVAGFSREKGPTEDIMRLSSDNYFIGYKSGANITTGLYNSFFGYQAGVYNTVGSSNVFIGNETGYGNDSGNWNILLGNNAGYSNNSGSGNIILGDYAGYSNTVGSFNVFMGDLSGFSNTDGDDNVYIGSDAGFNSTIASSNVFLGSSAGYSNTEGSSNVFLGESSGWSNTVGNTNIFIGDSSGYSNDSGVSNVFIGTKSGAFNGWGSHNVFLGNYTGYNNQGGHANVFLGQSTGVFNVSGSLNVSIGSHAGYSNVSGNSNVFIGNSAGYYETGSGKLYIDNAADTEYTSLIYGEFDNDYLSFYADVDVWGVMFYYDLFGTSDESLKNNISDLDPLLEKVKEMRAVEFDWKPDVDIKGSTPEGRQFGLIAQEVEALFPELVKENVKGQKAVNYTKLTVVLLQALKEQQAIIEDQERRLSDLESKIHSLLGPAN